MITCAEMAESLRLAAGRAEEVLTSVVMEVVVLAAAKARGYIGQPQDGWDPLSGATIEGFRHANGIWIPGKEELGYSPPDNELLRTGQMRDSIEAEVIGPLTGIIGSADKVALWQELGTPGAEYPIPPRPFLAKGLMETVPEAELLCEEAAVSLLVPGKL